ncbi:MAG: fibronectin type III domain-containing protein [Pseudomonadota bacterium]
MWKAARLGLLLCSVILIGPACGVKTPPLPADKLLPAEVSPPEFRIEEDGLLVISFRPPQKNVSGTPLKSLGGFIVDRSENKLEPGFCPGCPVRYTKRFEIEAAKPPPRKYVAERVYEFKDRLRPGYVYHYRLFAYDKGEDFDPARVRTLVVYYDNPIRPPEALEIRTEDRQVFLRWPAPDRLVDGRPVTDLAGYDIFRRQPDTDWTRINPAGPYKDNFFEDTRVTNGVSYEYKVRSVRQFRQTMIPGPFSIVVSARPTDLTPPPTPANVAAASIKKGVSLFWSGVSASDLAGYRVYRRRENETRFVRLGTELILNQTFLDTEVKQGEAYYYRVTAVDNAPAANESQPSAPVRIVYQP